MVNFFKINMVKQESQFYFELPFEILEQLVILHELSIRKGFLERMHGLKYGSNLFKNKEADISRFLYVTLFT